MHCNLSFAFEELWSHACFMGDAEGHTLPLLQSAEPTPPHMQAPAQTPPEAAATATAEAAVDAAPSVSDLGGNKANRATPAVRQLARELGIDLARTPLEGSGPEGRILAGDVFRCGCFLHSLRF
eukprot:1159247-Pelagomonas_calceolata.AAC.2